MERQRMTPKEIKEAMRAAGVLRIHGGTKWSTHYDPRTSTYEHRVDERHGNIGPRPLDITKWRRCSIYVTDEHGITRQTGTCDCHHGEWISEPAEWMTALLALLDKE